MTKQLELKRIDQQEMLGCSLVSKELPLSELQAVIKEACEHQIDADQKVLNNVKQSIVKKIERWLVTFCGFDINDDTDWQALKQKLGVK